MRSCPGLEPSPDLWRAASLLHHPDGDRSLVSLANFGLAVLGQALGSLATLESLGMAQSFSVAWECPLDPNVAWQRRLHFEVVKRWFSAPTAVEAVAWPNLILRSNLGVHPLSDSCSVSNSFSVNGQVTSWPLTQERPMASVLIDLKAPEFPADKSRPGLDVTFVVDRSGSMSGGPLQAATNAVADVLETLPKEDRSGVVLFDSSVETILEASDGGEVEARKSTADLLRDVRTGGSTFLSGGWTAGANQLSQLSQLASGQDAEGRIRQVILLTDGHGNSGETNPEQLHAHADRALQQGVQTSCIGIGDHYMPLQVQALADGGAGRLHHATDKHELVQALLEEVQSAGHMMLSQANLMVEIPEGLQVECHGVTGLHRRPGALEIPVGGMLAGATRTIALFVSRSEADDSSENIKLPEVLKMRWTGNPVHEDQEALDLHYELELQDQPENLSLVEQAAKVWSSAMMNHYASREHVRFDVEEFEGMLSLFERFVQGTNQAECLLSDLRMMRERLEHGWASSSRRELAALARKDFRNEHDVRVARMSKASMLRDADDSMYYNKRARHLEFQLAQVDKKILQAKPSERAGLNKERERLVDMIEITKSKFGR